ncbi:MAG TPA: hypothetical protein VMT88_03210 [Actinomycetes bacterium]|nr:hypothetical protein [Actinomycetes bacterium]
MTEQFKVLHVCTGNIGRSPMAERLMRRHLQANLGEDAQAFDVRSAGTWGCAGSSAEDYALLALNSRGIDASDFVARELTENMLNEADLVLTATTEHRGQVVVMRPSVVRRAFTLREFARLQALVAEQADDAGESTVARAKSRVELAGRVRGLSERLDPSHDDVEDPLGAPATFYEARAYDIDQACRRAVDLLVGQRH